MTSMLRALKTCLGPVTAVLAAAVCLAPSASAASSYTTHGAWSFISASGLHPPKVKTDAKTQKGLASGYWLLANFKNLLSPKPSVGQGGPLILDKNLQPVWFKPAPSGQYTNNLAEQTYNGKPALSWWQGVVSNTGLTTSGEDVIVDQHYHTVATLKASAPWIITQHELVIQGTHAWVTANSAPGSYPTTTVNGQSVPVIDSAVLEFDLTKPGSAPTVVWDAMQHVPLSQSQASMIPGAPWDPYHINSVQPVSGGAHGRLLISLRNTWAAYLVDIATGDTVWTLGGTGSTFSIPKSAQFQWQHDVTLHSGGLVTLFDDACCDITGNKASPFGTVYGPSRGLLLRLDTSNNTVSYVHGYVHPQVGGADIETAFQGGIQLLRNKNVVVGWGSAPFFSEFSYSGKLLFDAVLPSPDVNYRAYVQSWVGAPPLSELRHAVKTKKGKPTIYVSWNGATQVKAWRVLGGSSSKHLRTVATSTKRSFETAIKLAKGYHTYEVRALDSRGHVIGTSKPFGAKSKPVYGGY
jgi:hypothetical protein